MYRNNLQPVPEDISCLNDDTVLEGERGEWRGQQAFKSVIVSSWLPYLPDCRQISSALLSRYQSLAKSVAAYSGSMAFNLVKLYGG